MILNNINIIGRIGKFSGGKRSPLYSSHLSLLSGETTTLRVGSAMSDLAIFITYTAIQGTQSEVGEITIASPFNNLVDPPIVSSNFDDIGMSFTASIVNGDILLGVTVGAVPDTVIDFHYDCEVLYGVKTISSSMIFVSEGATFSPVIEVEDGTTVLWEFDDDTTSTAVNPTVDYGTAGSRQNKLTVTPWSGLIGINIGYDRSDGGWATPANLAQQNVSSIISLSLAAPSLTYFTCNHNANLTYLDFTGFDKLIQLEAYNAGLININLTGCTALRRLCLETCELIALDISDCVALEDLRGALNDFDYINFGSIGASMWHICVRDNAYSSNLPHPRQFPLLREFFLWTSQQNGHLDMSENPRCSSVQVYNNQYTSADFRGAFTVNVGSINIRNNLLTSLLVSGCPTLSTLNASNNNLSDEAVCQVLIDMDNNGRENGTLNLSGNSVPTGVDGLAALDSLRLKDWDVTVDTV